MITPIHAIFDIGLFSLICTTGIVEAQRGDLAILLSVLLIDLDHFAAKPVYDPTRNSFEAHLFHRNWKVLSIISIILVTCYRPLMFLGIGVLSHFLLDYAYNKVHNLRVLNEASLRYFILGFRKVKVSIAFILLARRWRAR